jgi:hypothetical protein
MCKAFEVSSSPSITIMFESALVPRQQAGGSITTKMHIVVSHRRSTESLFTLLAYPVLKLSFDIAKIIMTGYYSSPF